MFLKGVWRCLLQDVDVMRHATSFFQMRGVPHPDVKARHFLFCAEWWAEVDGARGREMKKMTIGKEVKEFLDSITAMVSNSNDEIVSVSAHVVDVPNKVDRTITYSVDKGTVVSLSPIVSPLDVYNRLWDCRKLEIELVWKRAAFISAFVISCFTAYGFVLSEILSEGIGKIAIHNFLAMAIAAFGFLLASLWVAMAKGSKAWQEVYEQALIAWGQTYCKCGITNWEKIVAGKWWLIPDYKNRERNWWGMCGGNFSVSAINILLGFVFATVWGTMIGVHVFLQVRFCPALSHILYSVLLWGVIVGEVVLALLSYIWLATSSTLKKEVLPSKP